MSDEMIKETQTYLLAEASKALKYGGSFMPFAAGLRANGLKTDYQIERDAAGEDPHARIALLVDAMREDDQSYKLVCAGLVFDGEIRLKDGEAVNAVCMHIEQKGGEAVEVFVPYVREPEGKLSFFDAIYAPTEPDVFVRA